MAVGDLSLQQRLQRLMIAEYSCDKNTPKRIVPGTLGVGLPAFVGQVGE